MQAVQRPAATRVWVQVGRGVHSLTRGGIPFASSGQSEDSELSRGTRRPRGELRTHASGRGGVRGSRGTVRRAPCAVRVDVRVFVRAPRARACVCACAACPCLCLCVRRIAVPDVQ